MATLGEIPPSYKAAITTAVRLNCSCISVFKLVEQPRSTGRPSQALGGATREGVSERLTPAYLFCCRRSWESLPVLKGDPRQCPPPFRNPDGAGAAVGLITAVLED